ncbi:MAG: hypothetical protein L6R42_000608 [Xanthoria sp. 1 TBL-2021]|nr:MAG: hypothetical protein L6R42_000608 [Xanthoria sp. 1 TBL-2021]
MSSPPGNPISSEPQAPPKPSPTPESSTSASATSVEDFAGPPAALQPLRPPSLRAVSEVPSLSGTNAISNPLGAVNNARRPGPPPSSLATARTGGLPQDMQAKMKAFHLSRQGAPPLQNLRMPSNSPDSPTANQLPSSAGALPSGISPKDFATSDVKTPVGPTVGSFRVPVGARPQPANYNSAPAVPVAKLNPKISLAAKRGLNKGMKLSDASGPAATATGQTPSGAPSNPSNTSVDGGQAASGTTGSSTDSMFAKYSEFVDTKTGTLKFKGKATIHGKGIDFSSGTSFSISLDEVDNLEELGKGNYGTVYKVRHSRPHIRRPGQGLGGNRALAGASSATLSPGVNDETVSFEDPASTSTPNSSTTGLVMAMKEIRLELDEAKFAAIIMELDILHRCVSPFIIDFFGAFFQEGAVYICMEFMDGGSVDKLYGDGVPEGVLRKIAVSTVMGLKCLKDDHNIIHRDVKPTNILVNSRGQVKICDFGVSGNLVASIAKTNIGCQSYMAPERIASGGVAQAGANPGGGTYSVQSDIWSLGLSIIECAMGQYPYPPETYNNIFSQLSAIVDGEAPDLPADEFSDEAKDFVRGCLNKIPKLRPTYAMLLRHPWLAPLLKPPTISEEDEDASNVDNEASSDGGSKPPVLDQEIADWVRGAMERRRNGTMGKKSKPALHAAPLDAVPSPTPPAAVT